MRIHGRSKILGLAWLLTGSVALAQGIPQGPAGDGPPPAQQAAGGRQIAGGQQAPGPPQRVQPQNADGTRLAPRRREALTVPATPVGPSPSRLDGGRPPLERAMGRWWNNPDMVEKLGVTAEQTKKMEDIFQQHRLTLIDLNASLLKAEAIMEPMMGADQPDEAKIVAQIDRVAQARAELEKANARMLLAIRQVLTPDQWKKLQERPRAVGTASPVPRR